MIHTAFQAGASGIPFTPVQGLIGSDIVRVRSDFKLIDNPYDPGRHILVVPAINPEIGLLHGLRADPDGNMVTSAAIDANHIAQASRRVVATVEEIRPDALDSLSADEIVIPSIYFDAIAPAPFGSHPLACPGRYERDRAHLREYMAAGRNDESFAAYLNRYVFETKDHAGYLAYALAAVAP